MSNAQNLLVVLSDEHQARAMGWAGHPLVKTPNLDRFAAQATRFTNAYTPSPICVPARASFATGRHVHETRLWDNAMPYTGAIPGWGHALQSAGVPVESIGKLHYRHADDPDGFDQKHMPMMVVDGIGMVWASMRRPEERVSGRPRMLGPRIGAGESAYTAYDRDVTETTCDWLSRHADDDTPWCLYVGLVAPHFPLIAPPDFYDLYPADALPNPKLHPRDGYERHPWVELQNAFMDSEGAFTEEDERLRAMSAYFGLCSWLDHNVGRILDTLETVGLSERTTVVYSSDHGDNNGARGMWGKSCLYQESTHVPLLAKGPDFPAGDCDTPVSLLDLSAGIAAHFGTSIAASDGVRPLQDIARKPTEPDRPILSQYHAAGAVSAAYMLRIGRWKYHHYVGFSPELFDLETDPEEARDLAQDPAFAAQLAEMEKALRAQLDPDAVNAQAFADQDALVVSYGGPEAARALGAPGATPPPAAPGR
ncbi:MAG: sulfatase-like hydrolase/transferase [Pseudomonadota bacterium]